MSDKGRALSQWTETFRKVAMGFVRVAALVLAVPAVGNGVSAQASQDASPEPSVELPAAFERVLRDYESRWSGGDADGLADLFVDDGLIVRGGTWIRGRTAIRRAYQGVGGALRLRAIEYAADRDVGFIIGAYGYGDGLPAEDRGLFVLTLRRNPTGHWLIVSDMDRPGG